MPTQIAAEPSGELGLGTTKVPVTAVKVPWNVVSYGFIMIE